MEFKDKGPWQLADSFGFAIESDDFTHDVRLKICGDFGSDADRVKYAQGLCDVLNKRGALNTGIKVQFGITDSADFEEKTWTFMMGNEYRVAAGKYAILTEDEYNRLLEMANKDN